MDTEGTHCLWAAFSRWEMCRRVTPVRCGCRCATALTPRRREDQRSPAGVLVN